MLFDIRHLLSRFGKLVVVKCNYELARHLHTFNGVMTSYWLFSFQFHLRLLGIVVHMYAVKCYFRNKVLSVYLSSMYIVER